MGRKLRSADTLFAPAVHDALNALQIAAEDVAAAQLARRYAEALDKAPDDAEVLAEFGPKLLSVLTALGATPRGRAALGRKSAQPRGTRRLEVLRAARQ
jgi:hypothetical protein